MAIVLIPGCALIAVEAREILALLFSRTYEAGAPFLVLLAFAQGLCYTVFMTFSNLLIAAGRQYASATLAVFLLAFAAATSAVGVHFLGALGAALGSLVANAIAVVATTVLVVRTLRPRLDVAMLMKLALATAVVCMASAAVPAAGLLLLAKLVALGCVLFALLFLLRVINPADFEPYLRTSRKRLTPRRSA